MGWPQPVDKKCTCKAQGSRGWETKIRIREETVIEKKAVIRKEKERIRRAKAKTESWKLSE